MVTVRTMDGETVEGEMQMETDDTNVADTSTASWPQISIPPLQKATRRRLQVTF